MSIDSISNLEGGLSVRNKLNEAIQQANAAAAHIGRTDNPHGVTKSQVGLAQVDNVSASALRARSTHTGTQPLSSISDAGTAASRDVDAFEPAGAAEQAAQAAQDYAVQRSNHTGTQPISSVSGLQSALDDLNPQNNLDAGGPPGASDDETAGYSELSLWVYDGTVYRCIDATAGAAVWVETGISVEDLGSAALAEVEDFDPAGSAQAAEENAAEYTDDAVAPLSRAQALRDLRDAATLDLDFASGDYTVDTGEKLRTTNAGEMLTVERATPKWVFGPNGKLREVPPNTLARQWNPATGEPEGVLNEESRTNRLTWSEDVAGWSKGSATELEATSVPSPIPGVNYLKLYTLDDASQANINKNYNISDRVNGVHTCSFFVKSAGAAVVRFQIGSRYDPYSRGIGVLYLETGEFSYLVSGAFTNINGSAIPLGNGEYRVSVTGVQNADANLGLYVYAYDEYGDGIDNSIAAGSGLYVTGFQLEEGSTPSSYIPTTDSPVTRAADIVIRELGDEFNNNGFTIYAEGVQGSDIGSLFYMSGEAGLADSLRVGVPTNNGQAMFIRSGGNTISGVHLSNTFPNYTVGDPAKVAVSVNTDTGQLVLAINGESAVRTASDIPELSRLRAGNLSLNNNNINGAMSGVALYPYAMTETELEELTANG